jgi:hypothetical protein
LHLDVHGLVVGLQETSYSQQVDLFVQEIKEVRIRSIKKPSISIRVIESDVITPNPDIETLVVEIAVGENPTVVCFPVRPQFLKAVFDKIKETTHIS